MTRADLPAGERGMPATLTALEGDLFVFEGLVAARYAAEAQWESFSSVAVERVLAVGEAGDLGVLVLEPPVPVAGLEATVSGVAQRLGAPDGTHGDIEVSAQGFPYSTETTPDGLFELALPPGAYTLVFSASGYEAQTIDLRLEPGEQEPLDSPVLLAAQPGRLRGRVEFAPGYEADGALRNVTVVLSRVDTMGVPASTLVQERQGFLFEGLPAGLYRVEAHAEAYVSAPVEHMLGIGEEIDVGLLLLHPPPLGDPARARVRGRAERVGAPEDGHGGILVEARDTQLRAETATDGSFEIGVPSGHQRLHFTSPGYAAPADVDLQLADGETLTLAEIVLLNGQPGRLRGLVAIVGGAEPVDPGVLPEIAIDLFAPGEPAPRRTEHPDSDGQYIFEPVPAGTWRIVARLEGFEPFPRLVTLLPGEEATVELITLRTPGDAGAPRTFVQGTALLECAAGCDHGGIRIEADGYGYVTQTASDGRFRLELSAADHLLVFSHPGYAPQSRQLANLVDGENRFEEVAVDARPVELDAADGRLSGSVVLSQFDSAARLATVRVALQTAAGALIGPLPVDAAGAFAFDGLRPGSSTVQATAPGYTTASTSGEVAGAAEARVGVQLLRHQSETDERVPLAVFVTLDDGAAPVGCSVRVTFAADEALYASALTDASGAVELSASPDEDYFLEVAHPGYTPPGRQGPYHWTSGAGGRPGGFLDLDGEAPAVTLTQRPLDGRITLRIRITPDWLPLGERWASVRLVGSDEQRGVDVAPESDTPLTFTGLAAGPWLLRVSRPGFGTFESVVALGPNQAERDFGVIDVALTDLGAANLELGALTLTPAQLGPDIDLRGANLSRVTFHGDFSSRDFSDADLTLATFTGEPVANLRGAFLTRARLFGARMVGADLTGAHLEFASLFGADLRGARLSGADLRYANLTAADLSSAVFVEPGEPMPSPPCTGVDRPGVLLEGVTFTQADLTAARMAGVDLRGATLSSARLESTVLDGACLTEAIANLTDLSGSRFAGADLSRAQLIGAIMLATDFRGARLENASAISAIIERADFGCRESDERGACDCPHALAEYDGGVCDAALGEPAAGCDCRARMRGISLNGSNLVGARMVDADLREATLVGAELGDAVLPDDAPDDPRVSWDCPAECVAGDAGACPAPPRACGVVPTSFSGSMLDRADLSGLHFAHVDLAGARFRHATLSDASFSRSRLDDVDFTGADLDAAGFGGQTLTRVLLDEASLAGTDLRRTVCQPCRMHRARLVATQLDGLVAPAGLDVTDATLVDVELTEPSFPVFVGAGMRVTGGAWNRVRLENADLTNAAFSATSFEDFEVVDSDLTDARFDRVIFFASGTFGAGSRPATDVAVRFERANLTRTGFHNDDWQGDPKFVATDTAVSLNFDCGDSYDPEQAPLLRGFRWPLFLDGASFRNCLFRTSIYGDELSGFDGTSLADADFSGAHLEGGAWRGVSAPRIRFVGTHFTSFSLGRWVEGFWPPELSAGRFEDAVATGSVWQGCGIYGGSMDRIDLSGANLAVNFVGCSLRDANFRGARFEGGQFDHFDFQTPSPTNLDGADFRDVTSVGVGAYRGVGFFGVSLRRTDWRTGGQPAFRWGDRCDLTDANVTGVDLSRSCAVGNITWEYLRDYSAGPGALDQVGRCINPL